MTKVFASLYLILLLCSSCRKCNEGCNVVYRIKGATLEVSDTLISLLQANASIVFTAKSYADSQKGTRDCPGKSPVSCTEDALVASKMALYCNKDIVIGAKLYPMNTNLMAQSELLGATNPNQFNIPSVILNTQSDFDAGRYHFLLRGETQNGLFFEDITMVEWR